MIHEIKFVRKVLRVKPIPNQIPHINIHKSTHKTHSVIENPVMSTIIFTVLLITPMISSLLPSSQIFALSRYQNIFPWINLERINVKNITITAKIIFSRTSVEKNQKRISVKFRVCSISFPELTAASAEYENKKKILKI